MTVDAEQLVDRGVVEADDDLRLQVFGRRNGEDVPERRAEIPEGVAVGALLVAPGVAPEGAGCDQNRGRCRYRRLPTGSFDDRLSIITRTNPPEAVGVGGVVVDAGVETIEVATDVVELQVVARAGSAGSAVEGFPGRCRGCRV